MCQAAPVGEVNMSKAAVREGYKVNIKQFPRIRASAPPHDTRWPKLDRRAFPSGSQVTPNLRILMTKM